MLASATGIAPSSVIRSLSVAILFWWFVIDSGFAVIAVVLAVLFTIWSALSLFIGIGRYRGTNTDEILNGR